LQLLGTTPYLLALISEILYNSFPWHCYTALQLVGTMPYLLALMSEILLNSGASGITAFHGIAIRHCSLSAQCRIF